MNHARCSALLDGHRALVHFADAVAEHEHAVACEQRDVGGSHLGDREVGVVGVVDATVVLVDHRDLAATQRRALVVAAGDPTQVRVHRGPVRVVVHREHDVGAGPVEREVELHAGGGRPLALQHVAVDVDADHVFGPELVPEQEPRVGQERAVFEAVRDVAAEVVVVALAPQGTGEQHDLGPPGERRQQPVRGCDER